MNQLFVQSLTLFVRGGEIDSFCSKRASGFAGEISHVVSLGENLLMKGDNISCIILLG